MHKHTKERVLLIAPVFFGYYNEIQTELENEGYEVTYICDAPSNSNVSKALARVNKQLIARATEKYFIQDVLPRVTHTKYQFMLVIAGMTFALSAQMVEQLRQLQPDACFLLYQWDSERNLPYVTSIHRYFDRLYSFDMYDSEVNSKYRFLPLFYTRSYEQIPDISQCNIEYDCSYIGTAHTKKYFAITNMSKALQKKMPRQWIYHYMPSKLKLLYQWVMEREFRNANFSDFQYEKISAEQMCEIYKKSTCILDAPQAGQTGLTMRTLEALGARRKLVTTNSDIRKYDFYREENILVYEGELDLNAPFFTHEYQALPDVVYGRYSLRSWLRQMLKDI